MKTVFRLEATRRIATALFATTLVAAASPIRAQSDCSALGQTSYVRDVLEDVYLWNRELPRIDPALFDTPEAYLEAVRYRPLDTSFSYITGRAASDAFFSESQFVGLGVTLRATGPREARVSLVYAGSPAAEAGLRRGDRLIAVDGRAVAELLPAGQLTPAIGPPVDGHETHLVWRDAEGVERQALLVARPVTIPTVSLTRIFEVDGWRVGYLHFRNFVRPSIAALDDAFAALRGAGADMLILDLRYNGGGLVSVAQHLAGLIGGSLTLGRVLGRYRHNDRNGFRDQTLLFTRPSEALGVRRLVVITTRASASASELLINGLRPFLEVTVVGERSYGKPVGQYVYEFCDKVFFPVAFSIRNARDEGDYFDGLPVDCAAADDLDHPLGDHHEDSLAQAIRFVREGSCRAPGAFQASSREPERDLFQDPWRRLVGAH